METAEYNTRKTIIRVEKNKDNPFVMMDRRPLEKPYLSWKAKGLLAYLLSRPDNWTINVGDLIKRSTDGEHATRAALKELEAAGHIKIETERDQKGKITKWSYTVYESPLCENQHVDNQHVENRHINDKDINDSSEEEGKPQTQNVFELFQQEIGALTPMIAQSLEDDEKEHGPVWVGEAIKIASQRGARNYKYISAILKRWKVDGYGAEFKKNGKNKDTRTPLQRYRDNLEMEPA